MSESTFRAIVQSYLDRDYPVASAVGYAAAEAADCGWRIKRLRRLSAEYGVSLESALQTVGEAVWSIVAIRKAEIAAANRAAAENVRSRA